MNFFQTPEYLAVFKRHFCRGQKLVDKIWEEYQDKLVLLGMKPVLGKEEVTDYAPTDIKVLPQGYQQIQLDYVREDSQTCQRFGPGKPQEVAPYIDLPLSWEEHLSQLERHYRKELKRKLRRLEETGYQLSSGSMAEFIRLHRLSDPAKNKFMSQPMAEFFKDVYQAEIPGWEQRLSFLKINHQSAAAIISFDSADEVWLYNSGYDPQFSFYSPGLLLKALDIKQAIEQGKKKYDFLRGSERYKYELGGKDLQLYQIKLQS